METVEQGAGVHLGIGLCALCGEKGARGGRRSEVLDSINRIYRVEIGVEARKS